MCRPQATVRRILLAALVLGALPLADAAAAISPAPDNTPPRSRTFLFTYAATVTGLKPGQVARVWLPVPPSNQDQDVKVVSQDLPARPEFTREPGFGNHILYLEAKANAAGQVPLSVTYRVTRREVKRDRGSLADEAEPLAKFLRPNAMIPLGGKPMELLKGKPLPQDQLAAARVLYDVVDDHMHYSKQGTGWGRGDAVWACDSGYGNCTDFHSLFMSLCRSLKIPAQFEIGFPLPEKRGAGAVSGYHCWAKFKPAGHGWIPVDISEANQHPELRDYYFGHLTPDRVAFSTGRDINLVPRQDGGPLNFFIYPYVEVAGQPYPADKVQRKFTFEDVKEP